MPTETATAAPARRLPLHDFHVARGARMVPFAGYEMPVHYPPGVLKEHLHTRSAAGLFDVSHMGQIALRTGAGQLNDALRALESLMPSNLLGLLPGRQRYTLLTTASGGIADDLMVINSGDHLLLIVNAACKEADAALLTAHLGAHFQIELLQERALLALQGPLACQVLMALAPEVQGMRFMDARSLRIQGETCYITRSGYTGEDGFEISIPVAVVPAVAQRLLDNPAVQLIGLGARDSLRLEAGLCLYGNDLDLSTSPVEAALEWVVAAARRPGGERAGGFPGAENILGQLLGGASRRRVGLSSSLRPIRAGTPLFRTLDDATPSVK